MPEAHEIARAGGLGLVSTRRIASRLTGGGTDGNERLTNATGALLLILLAVIGVTILQVRQLMSVHLFVGMMLIGPLALKLGSTGYRFTRYYTHNPAYRRKGPPLTALRLLAPAVVVTTLVVFASGVALLFAGPSSRSTLLPIHKVGFFVWLGAAVPHVLAHLPGMPASLRADYGRRTQLGPELPGRSGRGLALAGVIAAGVVLAVLSIPQFAPWEQFHHVHR